MRIITLDLGTMTGWCAGDTIGTVRAPQWGIWALAGTKQLNASFLGLHNELTALIETQRPGYVLYEQPLTMVGRDSSRNTVDLLLGLAAVTRLTCKLLGADVYEQGFAEVRKAVIGKGTFAKPLYGRGKFKPKTGKWAGDAKEEVQLWCERYGWGEIDHPDARDAAVLFRYGQLLAEKRAA